MRNIIKKLEQRYFTEEKEVRVMENQTLKEWADSWAEKEKKQRDTMEKQKHTEGPWKVGDRIHDYERDYYWCVTVFADNADFGNKVPAEVFAKDREQARANAALIAASPELLEACRWLLMACEDVQEGQAKGYFEKGMRLGREAIKKAEVRQ